MQCGGVADTECGPPSSDTRLCLGPEHRGCLHLGPSSLRRQGEKWGARTLPGVWPVRQRLASF